MLIGGSTIQECYANLMATINRFKEYGFRIKIEKCSFFKESVKYLGHIISEEGLRPNPEKVQAIVEAPIPKDITQLKSYTGLIN